ncbi:VOC family protein [Actinophytocola sp.]|uniref:VOC family protein n=1 Tax=Actinophytocola sp. TaxID=1872138 RepID=UPI002D7F2188|nr:VOC family protein [Actinophytocola sp.]HET9141141.1 VOC family protein [Actinophytocola sp.]
MTPPTLRTPRLTLRPTGAGTWACEQDGTVLGTAHLHPGGELPGPLLDCRLPDPRLSAEAAEALLRYAFGTLAAPAVFALAREPSGVPAGFREVGERDGARLLVALPPVAGRLHHVELWVADLAATEASWGWLLTELGWTEYQRWEHGVSWRLGPTYLVFEDSPARQGERHDRMGPGLNHIALHAACPEAVERLVRAGAAHGWRLMFADRHPHAGGPDHYAAYLENGDGYEVELVADSA